MTSVFAGTLSGMFLPPQLIYEGKPKACLPKVEFPQDLNITSTVNHWAYEDSMKKYTGTSCMEKTKQALKVAWEPESTVYYGQFLCPVH